MSLKTKTQTEFYAYISDAGYLCIKQEDIEFGREVCIMLAPDQYKSLCSFVGDNINFFNRAWNNGIELESDE